MSSDRIAVLIPAHNEGCVLGRTLQSVLFAGVLPGDVFVIDDGSTDHTAHVATSFGVNVLVKPKNSGKARAIAFGAWYFGLVARYGIISLLDADTQVDVNYFRIVRQKFKSSKTAVVCGQVKSAPHNWLTAYRATSYFAAQSVYKAGQSQMGVIMVAPGCAASYRADVFAKLDWMGISTRVEDMEITIQVHEKSLGRMVYAPEALVHTQDPRTLEDYTRQMARWQRGTWQVGHKFGLWSKWTKLAIEYKLLMSEGMLFSLVLLTLPLWALIFPRMALWTVGMDSLFLFGMGFLCGICQRRKDVALYAPLYPILRFLDAVLFAASFFGPRKKRTAIQWSSVGRY